MKDKEKKKKHLQVMKRNLNEQKTGSVCRQVQWSAGAPLTDSVSVIWMHSKTQ